jgi:hypothetical protein
MQELFLRAVQAQAERVVPSPAWMAAIGHGSLCERPELFAAGSIFRSCDAPVENRQSFM